MGNTLRMSLVLVSGLALMGCEREETVPEMEGEPTSVEVSPTGVQIEGPTGKVGVTADGVHVQGPTGKVRVGPEGVQVEGGGNRVNVRADGVEVREGAAEEENKDEGAAPTEVRVRTGTPSGTVEVRSGDVRVGGAGGVQVTQQPGGRQTIRVGGLRVNVPAESE